VRPSPLTFGWSKEDGPGLREGEVLLRTLWLGADGFEKAVARVAELEKKVDLYDLTQFTPKT
jgi:hypothetical protein